MSEQSELDERLADLNDNVADAYDPGDNPDLVVADDTFDVDALESPETPPPTFAPAPHAIAVVPRRRSRVDPAPLCDVIAERAVIGRAFWEPNENFGALVPMLTPEMFWLPEHRALFSLMLARFARRQPNDMLSLKNALTDHDPSLLDKLGGVAGLAHYTDEYFRGMNWKDYARSVKDCWRLRRVEAIGRDVVDIAYCGDSVDEIEAAAVAALARIEREHSERSVSDALRERINADTRRDRVETGIRYLDLDVLHGGLVPGYYVLAGRTSEGKSALMLTILTDVVLHQHKSALLVSVEMSETVIGLRIAAIEHRQNASKLINSDLSALDQTERDAIANAAFALERERLTVVPRSQKPSEIRARAHQLKRDRGLDVICVDYLQRLHPDRVLHNRVVEVGMISGAMKEISEELQVPVIALAQLSRAAVGREKPSLHHLRESGDIEQDADQVWLLSRTEGEALLDVAKNRNGKLAEIAMRFVSTEMRFTEAARY